MQQLNAKDPDPLTILSLSFGEGKLESSYRGEYSFECPKCGGKIHANILKGGVFVCCVCGYKGNAYTLISELGLFRSRISLNESYSAKREDEVDWELLSNIYTEAIKSSFLREYHSRWLSNRGIITDPSNPVYFKGVSSDGILQKLKSKFSIAQLISAGLLTEDKRIAGVIRGNRIIIPYYSPGNKCIYIRSRFAGISEDFRFLAPTGVPAGNFVWGWETYNNSHYVIVTEGELKAQSAKQLGLECVALPGMHVGHKAFVQDCLDRNIETVFILFDTEGRININTGLRKQDEIDRCTNDLASLLTKKNIQAVICYLPLLGQSKMDIDRFILMKKDRAKEELLSVLKRGVLYSWTKTFGT